MIRRPIVIGGILKEEDPGGFSGGTDGGDGQRIAILAGVVEEGTRGSLKKTWVREVELRRKRKEKIQLIFRRRNTWSLFIHLSQPADGVGLSRGLGSETRGAGGGRGGGPGRSPGCVSDRTA